jgi:hypothetical protein
MPLVLALDLNPVRLSAERILWECWPPCAAEGALSRLDRPVPAVA